MKEPETGTYEITGDVCHISGLPILTNTYINCASLPCQT